MSFFSVNNYSPHPTSYRAYMRMALNSKDTLNKVENLLNLFAVNDIRPTKDIAEEIMDVLHSFGYSGTYTTVHK